MADNWQDWKPHEEQRQYHEASSLFPLLEGDDFDELCADIQEHGLLEPIWIHPDDGSIIDGRNRHRACIVTLTKPRFRTWNGDGSLVSFVVSMNLHRRHLSSFQRACVAQDMLPLLEKEARKRQAHDGLCHEVVEIIPQPENINRSRAVAAEMFHTNPRYVQDAKKLKQEAPDLFERAKEGGLTRTQAIRELRHRQKPDAPELPDGKYRVLYADPPWQYSDKLVEGYGPAENHYPSMSIRELCAMGEAVQEMSRENAVLFLWTTSPMLEDSFKVIHAWGFQYKTSFVWDKVKHNYGHYNSVRHELLLICTRGSCTPDTKTLFDSVQRVERSDRHSEKPSRFREIIDTLYPHGKRIELFARGATDGWDVWGNEAQQHQAC